jgi:predicted TIM-barrel fold metal-dependent hydrolase
VITAEDAPIDVLITLQPMNIVQAAADLIWSRVPKEFPTIKFALVEGGTGWIPYFLARIDYTYEHHHLWTGQDFGDRLPSQVFKERFITCFIDDPVGVKLRDEAGLDNMTWECDYPHSDCTWPESPELLMKSLAGVPDSDIDKITHANAVRLFRYDPISARGRERCTVGALRAEAAAARVDTSIHALGKRLDERGTTGTDLARGPRES